MADEMRAVIGGRSLELSPTGQTDIGRAPECALVVDDPRVSRFHAVVWSTHQGWVIADRGTPGGTWLGDDRVNQLVVGTTTRLRLGDRVDGPTLELIVGTAPHPAGGSATSVMRPAIATTSRPSGTFTTTYQPSTRVRIGRDADNDIVVDDLLVSRHHAELHLAPGGRNDLVDLGSLNGTYLNGQRIERAAIGELDLVAIGHSSFRLVGGHLELYRDTGIVTFEAAGVTVLARDRKPMVDDVSFALPERSLFGVVGPSGSGKSTLLAALAGLRRADAGHVLYGGRDLYRDYAELRHRIGVVPQEDVLHRELEVGRALQYAGRLRFPSDVSATERAARIDEVLGELGIRERATMPIHQLSGGERKRTSVALELLTKPSLLFLDEPTAGLDAGLAHSLMTLLRALADDGRTIIVVTHELSGLSLCDQILVLAPGGVPAYVGRPDRAAARFGRDHLAEVFADLSAPPAAGATSWRAPVAVAATAPMVPLPLPDIPVVDPGALPPSPATDVHARVPLDPAVGAAREAPAELPAPPRQSWWSQLRTLTARSIEVLSADRRNLALLLLQAPILGLLLLAALPAGELGSPAPSEVRLVSAAGIVLFVVLVGATWLGANNSIREVARELPVLRRERATGLSLSAYVVSKFVVLAGLTIVQSVVLVALSTARQQGPSEPLVLGWAPLELMVVVALAGVASMALGLFISSVAGSPERATSILPIVLILQLVLAAGVVLPEIVDKPVLRQLSYVSSAQWGIAGSASAVDLNELQAFGDKMREVRTVDAADPGTAVGALTEAPNPEPRWAHTTDAWLTAVIVLLVLTLLPLVGAAIALRRYDPGRAR
jgi:ABC-type multidrug transport system ATPase subunit/pSer/pThr/pTyr-binding forkhead associated (FHA) protein